MLGLLKRTCPLLTNPTVRRTLYLTLLRSQLSYATDVWSPHTTKLISKVESVQRRATAWILKSKRGDFSYKQRLTTLNLLLLCYEREITDLVFFYQALYANIDLDVRNFVSFVNNGRTRLGQNPTLTLKTPYCKSSLLSKHPTSTALLKCGTLHVKYFLQPASPASPLLKESLRTRIDTV